MQGEVGKRAAWRAVSPGFELDFGVGIGQLQPAVDRGRMMLAASADHGVHLAGMEFMSHFRRALDFQIFLCREQGDWLGRHDGNLRGWVLFRSLLPPSGIQAITGSWLADVFVPELRMGGDEYLHQLVTLGIVDHGDFHSPRADIFFRALESAVFADDDSGNAVKQDRAAAHVAWRQRGEKRGTAVVAPREPTGVFQTIHLGVQYRAALLHPPVMSTADDLAVDDQHRPDRDPALAEANSCFVNRSLEER